MSIVAKRSPISATAEHLFTGTFVWLEHNEDIKKTEQSRTWVQLYLDRVKLDPHKWANQTRPKTEIMPELSKQI